MITLPTWLGPGSLLEVSNLLVLAIVGCSIVVLTGWAGQVSLGQMSFAAVGAVAGAVAMIDWHWDLSLALLAAGTAAGGDRPSWSASRPSASTGSSWRSPPWPSAWPCRVTCSTGPSSRGSPRGSCPRPASSGFRSSRRTRCSPPASAWACWWWWPCTASGTAGSAGCCAP